MLLRTGDDGPRTTGIGRGERNGRTGRSVAGEPTMARVGPGDAVEVQLRAGSQPGGVEDGRPAEPAVARRTRVPPAGVRMAESPPAPTAPRAATRPPGSSPVVHDVRLLPPESTGDTVKRSTGTTPTATPAPSRAASRPPPVGTAGGVTFVADAQPSVVRSIIQLEPLGSTAHPVRASTINR